jgi:hypothetical protein
LKVSLSGTVTAPPVGAMSHITGDRQKQFWHRKRRAGNQGRPQKSPMLRTELWDWFCSIKRSVSGRITPKFVLRQAKTLSEDYAAACLKQGLPANLPQDPAGAASHHLVECGTGPDPRTRDCGAGPAVMEL